MTLFFSKNLSVADFDSNPSLETKIDVFRDRVLVWQIDIAVDMERQINLDDDRDRPMKHAGFAIISVLMSYFEMVAEVRTCIKKEPAGVRFARGFENVYPGMLTPDGVTKVWERVRCGLYHNAYANNGTIIGGKFPQPFEIDANDFVLMNPHRLVKTIKPHFLKLIDELKDPANVGLQQNFEKQFYVH